MKLWLCEQWLHPGPKKLITFNNYNYENNYKPRPNYAIGWQCPPINLILIIILSLSLQLVDSAPPLKFNINYNIKFISAIG